MWTSFDVVLGVAFMLAWAAAVSAGAACLIAACCLYIGRRASSPS